ncbi:MAG: DedA family protein [Longimicrobiales bacterium]
MWQIIGVLKELPVALFYCLLGLGAFVENLFPPIPADTFVLLGGALAVSSGVLKVDLIFLTVCSTNIVGALIVYGIGYSYGGPYFQRKRGGKIFNHKQLEELEIFYHRNGLMALFFARFIPGFRVAVPVFAGIVRLSPVKTVVVIGSASAVWYSFLLYAGLVIGENMAAITEFQDRLNLMLGVIAILLTAYATCWWMGSRGSK